MEAPLRGALLLVRLIGAAALIIAVLELGLYWAECSAPRHHVPVRFLPVLLRASRRSPGW